MSSLASLTSFGVSVLIPVYFSDTSVEKIRWLRRALESVREQDFPEGFEVVVIDDGSRTPLSDHIPELGAAAKGVRWVRAARNGGIVNALNLGLREARYPLIARLDADDAWCAGKVARQLALFERDPDLTITATGMTRVDELDTVIDEHIRPGDWNGILRFFVDGGCPFPHGSVIARRDVYRLLGGYPHDATFVHCEDFALWGTWLRFFKPAMLEESLYRYTVARSSVSVVHNDQQANASRLVHRRFAELDAPGRLPAALANLAGILNASVLHAGQFAYEMWRYGACFALPEPALDPLRIILGDRDVYVDASAIPDRRASGAFESRTDDLVTVIATSNGGRL